MLFFVKVQIDLNKLAELGEKIQNGELDLSPIKFTYCLKENPDVGISIWESDNEESFDNIFKKHKIFYKNILEITPIITTEESLSILTSQNLNHKN